MSNISKDDGDLRLNLADLRFNSQPGIEGSLGGNMEPEQFEALLAFVRGYVADKVLEADKDAYARGVNHFSNYFMDASMKAQRFPIMPHVAKELVEHYRPPKLKAQSLIDRLIKPKKSRP